MIENNHRDFWKEGKKVEGQSKPRAPHIDDKITPMDITDLFSEKYKTLYNSVPSDQFIIQQINKRIVDDLQECNC